LGKEKSTMVEIAAKDLLPKLIRARHSLKTDRPQEALRTIRELIKTIDPDRSMESALRGEPIPAPLRT
jgi:hypothetical protein